MTIKQEIAFWIKAKKIIEKEYGCRCKEKDFDAHCIECQAGEVVRFINSHISLIKDE